MSDPAATLRALADACDECNQISKSDSPRWLADQRHALTNALPDVTGWTATATALRAMADEVERLRAVIARIAAACATIDCEDLAAALTPDDYDDLGGHVEALVASHATYRATFERLRSNLRDIAEAFNGGETPIDDLPAVVRQYMEIEAKRARLGVSDV